MTEKTLNQSDDIEACYLRSSQVLAESQHDTKLLIDCSSLLITTFYFLLHTTPSMLLHKSSTQRLTMTIYSNGLLRYSGTTTLLLFSAFSPSRLLPSSISAKYFSASRAAIQPDPAEVIACLYLLS